nr:MAG: polyprotein [Bat pegivirus]
MASLVLFALLVGGGGVLASLPPSHRCKVGDNWLLTNCCSDSDVYLCILEGCFVSFGCTVCSAGQCWTPYRPGFVLRPGAHAGMMPDVMRKLYVGAAWSAYAADIFGVGEPYSLGLTGVAVAVWFVGERPPLQCDLACNVTWQGEGWRLATFLSRYTLPLEFLLELPVRVIHGLWAAGILAGFLLAVLILEQKLVMALLFLSAVGLVYGDFPQAYPCGVRQPGFTGCVCSPKGGFAKINVSQRCTCPFGTLTWGGLSGRFIAVAGTGRDKPGLCCPRYVSTFGTVTCQWGSIIYWWKPDRERRVDLWQLVPRGSALCTFYSSATGPALYSCVLDRRPRFCGECTRDCTMETGDMRRDFENCGLGPRLTKHLEAIPATFWDPIKNLPWPAGQRPTNPGVSGPVKATSAVVTKIGNTYHGVPCPPPPHPTLPALIPGVPVNNCDFLGLSWWDPFGIPGDLLKTCGPEGRLGSGVRRACPGFAWRVGRAGDGFIHSRGGIQEVDDGTFLPSPAFWFFDLVAVLLFLMKLSGARIVPVLVFFIWYQSNFYLSAFPVPVVVRNWYDGSVVPSATVATLYNAWAASAAPNFQILQHCNVFPCSALARHIYEADVLLTTGIRDLWGGMRIGWNTTKEWGTALLFRLDPHLLPWHERWRYLYGNISAWQLAQQLGAVIRNMSDVRNDSGYAALLPTYPPPTPAPTPLLAAVAHQIEELMQALEKLKASLGVEAMLHPAVVAGPLTAWSVWSDSWLVTVLGLCCVAVYTHWTGVPRMAVLVAAKLSRGMLGILVVLSVLHARRWSALGFELCVSVWSETDISLDWTWNLLALVIALGLVSFGLLTRRGRELKLSMYACWAVWYAWFARQLEISPAGRWSYWRRPLWIWVFACVCWPDACVTVSLILIGLAASLDCIDWVLEAMFIGQVDVSSLARWCDRVAWIVSSKTLDRVLRRAGDRGVYLYAHMGQVTQRLAERLREFGGGLEPAYVTPLDLERIRDDAFTLGCGVRCRGKPVIARRGEEVLIGTIRSVEDLPPGFTLTAPVVLKATGRGFFSVLTTSMLGRDGKEHDGNIMVLGTATTRSMGSCVSGLMYTTFHSSQARALASPSGPLNARWWSTSDDTVVYPLPSGAQSLEPCGCRPSSVWVLRNDGALCHGQALQNSVRLDVTMRVSEFEGSSGSPILCDNGHALGMLVSVRHRGSDVHEAVFTVPWNTMPKEVTCQAEAPPVPVDGFEEKPLFVPTGSGKSTRIPHGYAQLGHNVLVVNPSVATTLAMGPYMKKLTGKEPSVYAGHGATAHSRTTDSKLTYVTYGRFLAQPNRFLAWADVVICDEAHSMDSTSLLGIGVIRQRAKEQKVKLVLYATATPAGAPVVAHPNIKEIQLTGEGDLDFYGFRVESKKYLKGRHLIFCHSKEFCRQFAQEFTKRGCRAMYYYRGCDPAAIPDEGDLVVCATDALMTGYTGNFDTVTDCGIAVREEVTVTLDPTVTIALRMSPATADVRMQRRGRCGRGRSGTYYFCLEGASPSGTAPSGSVWGAVESAVAWYNMDPADAAAALRVYSACPYTAHVSGTLSEAVVVMEGLVPFRSDPEVDRMKRSGVSWPLLTGVQRRMCLEGDARPPSTDPQWAGLVGTNPCPLLLRWGLRAPDTICHHHITDDIVRRLGVSTVETDTYVAPILIVGLGVAAACAVAGATGTLVIVTSWTCAGGGHPVGVETLKHSKLSGYPPGDAIPARGAEGVVKTLTLPGGDPEGETTPSDIKKVKDPLVVINTKVGWDALAPFWAALTSKASAAWAPIKAWATGSGAVTVATVPGGSFSGVSWVGSTFVSAWTVLSSHLTELTTVGVAMWTAGSNPPLAIVSSLVLGVQTALGLEGRLAAGLLVGALGGTLGTPAVGAGMAAAFVVGGGVRRMPVVGYVLDLLCGWEAVATCASLTFDLLGGTAQWQDVWYCLAAVGSPGAGVAGAAIGVLLHIAFTRAPSEKWLNRLLTMLPKSSALPDDYFEHTNMRERASELLKKMSISRAVMRLLDPKESQTLCYSGVIGDFFDSVRRFFCWLWNWLKDSVPGVTVPMATCQRGYTGKWAGDGDVTTWCGCGASILATIRGGHIFDFRCSSRLCTNYWRKSIPINTRTRLSGARPDPGDGDHVYCTGFGSYVWVRRRGQEGELVGASDRVVTSGEIRGAGRPVYVNGESCDPSNSLVPPQRLLGPHQRVRFDGEDRVLPLTVYFPPDAADLEPPQPVLVPPPAPPSEEVVMTATQLLNKAFPMLSEFTPEDVQEIMASGDDPESSFLSQLDALNASAYESIPLTARPPETTTPQPSKEDSVKFLDSVSSVPSSMPPLEGSVYEETVEPLAQSQPLFHTEAAMAVVSTAVESAVSAVKAGADAVGGATVKLYEVIRPKKKKKSKSSSSSPSGSVKSIVKQPTPLVPLHIAMPCCDKSTRRVVDGSLSVKEVLDLTGWDWSGHNVYDETGSLVKPEDLMKDVRGDLRLSCASETKCGKSYLWSGAGIDCGLSKAPPITRPVGIFSGVDATRAYVTDMRDVALRIEKVTKDRTPFVPDKFFQRVFQSARGAALTAYPNPGFSYEEAVARVRPGAAPGHNQKLSVKDLQTPRGRELVEACVASIDECKDDHPFMLTAKQEVFYQDKKTRKPPRLICYPSLEFRVAEKMIMGDPGVVAKKIMGPAYGFQYTPVERVEVLRRMWASKKRPAAITVDAVCFDSTITPEDVDRETELYCLASPCPRLVNRLGKYYARGPMINRNGVVVGMRECRASGVLTTSSSNSITCYLKVTAACQKVGLKDFSLLIHGDDTLIIYEREDCDPCSDLKAALASYGYPCEPQLHASLDTAETCSTRLSECAVWGGRSPKKAFFLTTNFKKVLARACSEYGDPVASACGYALLYPYHPIVRHLLIPQVVCAGFRAGGRATDSVVCRVAGNTLTFPLKLLPSILVGIHGPDCLRVVSDTTGTLTETNSALQAFGLRGLSHYRRKTAMLRVAMLRAGGEWAALARALFWNPSLKVPPPTVQPRHGLPIKECFEHPYQSLEVSIGLPEPNRFGFAVACGVFCLGILLIILTHI